MHRVPERTEAQTENDGNTSWGSCTHSCRQSICLGKHFHSRLHSQEEVTEHCMPLCERGWHMMNGGQTVWTHMRTLQIHWLSHFLHGQRGQNLWWCCHITSLIVKIRGCGEKWPWTSKWIVPWLGSAHSVFWLPWMQNMAQLWQEGSSGRGH